MLLEVAGTVVGTGSSDGLASGGVILKYRANKVMPSFGFRILDARSSSSHRPGGVEPDRREIEQRIIRVYE